MNNGEVTEWGFFWGMLKQNSQLVAVASATVRLNKNNFKSSKIRIFVYLNCVGHD